MTPNQIQYAKTLHKSTYDLYQRFCKSYLSSTRKSLMNEFDMNTCGKQKINVLSYMKLAIDDNSYFEKAKEEIVKFMIPHDVK
jgi:hypothetical protein